MENYKPYIAMLFTQFVYAGMALFSKAAIAKGMNSFVFVVYRQALASLVLAPLAYFLERLTRTTPSFIFSHSSHVSFSLFCSASMLRLITFCGEFGFSCCSNKASPLSYNLLCKIFLISLCGLTMSLNLYYIAINYTSATFAAATTNTIPAITFIMAVLVRMETISISKVPGIAKVFGSALGLSGALVFAFIKGPAIKMKNWYPAIHEQNQGPSLMGCCSRGGWIKGSLMMILANILWSLWLVLQGPIVKQYPSKLRLTALQCLFSCILSALWATAVERDPSAWKLGWDFHLLSVAYCGIVVTGITYWLQVWTIDKKGPVFTAMFTPLALIITAIFSAFLWKETPHWGSLGGAVLLVGGLYSVLWGKSKEDDKSHRNDQNAETKEEITLECITSQ